MGHVHVPERQQHLVHKADGVQTEYKHPEAIYFIKQVYNVVIDSVSGRMCLKE